ncbi:MAG: NUDIX domain-containing protein [Vicinamibacterales bacterium]
MSHNKGERPDLYPPARSITSVGAVVVRDGGLLLGRLTYSPNRGRYLFPGGVVEPGEMPDDALVREVREETGVTIRPLGICAVLTAVYAGETHTYLLWRAEHVSGEPVADGVEIDDACFLPLDDLDGRTDVAPHVFHVAALLRGNGLACLTASEELDPFPEPVAALTNWKLFD